VPYFNTRDVVAISMCAAVWGVLASAILPIFFTLTNLPILCEMTAFTAIILAAWWTRKIGVASATGLVATLVNFVIRPSAFHFLGFTAASLLFDLLMALIGYTTCFGSSKTGAASIASVSLFSSAVAGILIGSLFMPPNLVTAVGGLAVFIGLHVVGGAIGASVGIVLVRALQLRGVVPVKMRVADERARAEKSP